MAFGMSLGEARQLVGAKLNIIHPLGNAGRMPWQSGETADVDWGVEEPWNLHALVKEIRTGTELRSRQQQAKQIISEVAGGKRLVFLGFGFDPLHTDLLTDYTLSHEPDVLAAVPGMTEAQRAAVMRTLKRMTGVEDETLLTLHDVRAFQLLRDYTLFLES